MEYIRNIDQYKTIFIMYLGEDLFLVTKLPPSGNRPEGVSKFIKKSLENLQVSYLDLYLVHTPFGFKDVEGDLHPIKDGEIDMDFTTDHVAVWKVKLHISFTLHIRRN